MQEISANSQSVNIKDLSFSFENSNIRTIEKDAEVWFVAKDIAVALEYPPSSLNQLSNLFGAIPKEWTTLNPIMGSTGNGGTVIRKVLCISEQGLYFFLGRSDKPKALPFQKWIAGEVIPSIRKYGMYATPLTVEQMIADPDSVIAILQALKEERAKRQYAERTKAWIGSKREATAMATASKYSRENEKLKEQIGDGKNYKQVKAISWLKDYFKLSRVAYQQIGKKLNKLSKSLGFAVKELEDSNYGTIKSYNVEVIGAFRRALDNDLNMLRAYRV